MPKTYELENENKINWHFVTLQRSSNFLYTALNEKYEQKWKFTLRTSSTPNNLYHWRLNNTSELVYAIVMRYFMREIYFPK